MMCICYVISLILTICYPNETNLPDDVLNQGLFANVGHWSPFDPQGMMGVQQR